MTDAERSQRVSRALKAGYRILSTPRRAHYVARLRHHEPPLRCSRDVATKAEATSLLISFTLADPSL